MTSSNRPKDRQGVKRHCMIVHAHYPLSETRVEREAQALRQRHYEVDVICLRNEEELPDETVDGIHVYRLPVKRHSRVGAGRQLLEYLAFFVLAFAKLVNLHHRQPYQTVQVHNLPDFLVFATWWAKLNGAWIILDIHDLMPEFFTARFNHSMSSWPGRLMILQEQLSCRFANHVITVSEHWRQTLIRRGVPAHKCSVVMNVADESIFNGSRDGAPKEKDGRFQLIYHGSIVQRYGLDLAVRAVDQVREEIPNIHLTILGMGDYVETLVQMVQELDLHRHVTIFNEYRPAHELPAIIRTATLGIVPYRNDPFTDQLLPTKLMEYAALGIPAVAARTSAIEAYFHNTMVELFEPGNIDHLADCLLKLYRNPDYLAELKLDSSKFNERYNWKRIGAEFVDLIDQANC